jgi:hypothetical protein
MRVRGALAGCAFLILVALHTEFITLPATFVRWNALQQTLSARPNGSWPEYPRFLQDVHEHTRPGDRIAIAVPGMRSEETYLYAFYRASYLLADRDVLPLYYAKVPQRENLASADYLAAWQTPTPSAHVVWRGHGGVLVSRR